MEDQQELVYGWLGLNPLLLLDPPPSGDNLMVRVVRPGEDAEAVLDDARQQLAASGSRRRRRGRGGGGEGRQSVGEAAGLERGERFERSRDADPSSMPASVTITPLPVAHGESISQPELVTVAVPVHRRTRPSALTSPPEESPAPEAAPPETLVPAEEVSASDPRRRRRRSSASA
jgi:ribonuclease E